MTFTYERRLATFRQLNWPHSKGNNKGKEYKSQPEDFAQAGFYCRPMAGSEDTVSCFLCLKSLDGWDPSDLAWQEHKNHSANCPLVTLNLYQSRLRTFDRWGGEKVAGGVAALADAGFFYFPKTDGDDTCFCYQCGLALDGWEANDDPHYEHSRRRPNCPHVAKKEYIKPASFDFLFAGESDDLAVKDITQAQVHQKREIVPVTPARKITTGQGPSTVKTSKKIRISVPTQITDPSSSSLTASTNTNTITESTPKASKNIKITKSAAVLKEFSTIFPELKSADEILNLTLEQFFDRLIKEKVGKFEDFLRRIEAESEN